MTLRDILTADGGHRQIVWLTVDQRSGASCGAASPLSCLLKAALGVALRRVRSDRRQAVR